MLRILATLLFVSIAFASAAQDPLEKLTPEQLQEVRTRLRAISALLKEGDYEKIAPLAQEVIEIVPEHSGAYVFRAEANLRMGNREEALKDYNKLIEMYPESYPLMITRGEIYLMMGRFKEAEADFNRVIELEPKQKMILWQLGLVEYFLGKYKEAYEQLEAHKEFNPSDSENAAWHFAAMARDPEIGPEKAKKNVMQLAEPDLRGETFHAIYKLFKGETNPEGVLKAAEAGEPESKVLNERLFFANYYIGLYYEALGQNDKAREYILKALQEHPLERNKMYSIAQVHARTRGWLSADEKSRN